MRNNYSRLDWDSNFFGFDVARITVTDIDETGLMEMLDELKFKNYRMAYWDIPIDKQETIRIAHACGGFLACEKVTYFKRLDNEIDAFSALPYIATPYTDVEPSPELISLGIQSGKYSRFRIDPSFPDDMCDKLYKCWLIRSVHKEIAWKVLVVKEDDNLLGMITLGLKNDRGDIGLLAVSSKARGKGIGKCLVMEAGKFFFEHRYINTQIVTQRANMAACRLYESCGYHIERTDNVFHFWL
ncbi:MAG: GNAT family N-acetyltransferase [Gammaproteobacteria bacterium]|nr:GNAT family N-acetyltransferase [Gammaproteobacteria bacterium]